MRTLVVTEVEQELPGIIPFVSGYTVVAINATATDEVLQSADTSGGSYANVATIPAGEAAEVVLNKPFIKLQDAGSLILLGN